jgi:hypothetical protein
MAFVWLNSSEYSIQHRVCNYSNTTGATSGAGTVYPSREAEFTPVFSGVRVTPSLIIFAMFCRSLFVLLVIVLSVLRFTDSDYPFGIFKLFIQTLLMIIKRVLSSAGFRQPVASLCLSSAIAMLSRKRYDKSILITCVMGPDILSNLFSNESGKRQSTFIVFKLSKYTKTLWLLRMMLYIYLCVEVSTVSQS